MPYPINQRAHQFNSIQSVFVSFGLWDTALKFLSPGPRSDVTDHLVPYRNIRVRVLPRAHSLVFRCLSFQVATSAITVMPTITAPMSIKTGLKVLITIH